MARTIGRFLLSLAARLVGTFGLLSIFSGIYALINKTPLKHRFLDFVALLVIGALMLVLGAWFAKRSEPSSVRSGCDSR
jgi:hypothetical protein